jgi:hypothetical protein
MKQVKELDEFLIEYNGKTYTCKPIERNGSILYQVNFNTSYLYLTQSNDRNGIFWTTIPADNKLKHIAQILGEKIENHLM